MARRKCGFRFAILLPMFGEARFTQFEPNRIVPANLRQQSLRFLHAPAYHRQRLHAELEQIGQRVFIRRVERHGALEGLPRTVGVMDSGHREGVFGAMSIGSREPRVEHRVIGPDRDRTFQRLGGFAVIGFSQIRAAENF